MKSGLFAIYTCMVLSQDCGGISAAGAKISSEIPGNF
jgi:hypothetical protein